MKGHCQKCSRMEEDRRSSGIIPPRGAMQPLQAPLPDAGLDARSLLPAQRASTAASLQRATGNRATAGWFGGRPAAPSKRVNLRLHGVQRAGAGGGGKSLALSRSEGAPEISIGAPRRAAAGWAVDLGVAPPDGSNEFGDTGEVPRRGPAPAPPAPAPAQPAPAPAAGSCDCCVDSVTISNVAPIDNATHMGHSFDVTIAMQYPASATASGQGHCTLQWFERTNVPYFPGMVAGAWNDMFALIPTSPTLAPWVDRRERCETSSAVTITDTPALGKTPGRTVTRTLEFNIVVSSSPVSSPNGCSNVSQHATATQVLDMVGGASNWAASSFVTP